MNLLDLLQGFRKLSSDIQTDSTALKLYATSLREWSMKTFRVVVWPEFFLQNRPNKAIRVRLPYFDPGSTRPRTSACSGTSTMASAASSPRIGGCQKLILRRYKSAAPSSEITGSVRTSPNRSSNHITRGDAAAAATRRDAATRADAACMDAPAPSQ